MTIQPPRRTGTAVLAARDKQRRALELRTEGRTLDQIADELGYASKSGASKAITAALDRHEAAAVDEYRDLEAARLNELQRAVWPLAVTGDIAAVTACVRIIDRRAKLLGLDAPVLVDVNASASTVDLDAAVSRIMEIARNQPATDQTGE